MLQRLARTACMDIQDPFKEHPDEVV